MSKTVVTHTVEGVTLTPGLLSVLLANPAFSYDSTKEYLTSSELSSLYSHLQSNASTTPSADPLSVFPAKSLRLHYVPVAVPASTRTPTEEVSYRARLDMLNRKVLDRQYASLTGSLGSSTNLYGVKSMDGAGVADEVNKLGNSGAIAANMIIAPVCFGAFLYSFMGPLFPGRVVAEGDVDTVLVVVAVLGGVALLFIEMILFVIRSDTIIAYDKKKERAHERAIYGGDGGKRAPSERGGEKKDRAKPTPAAATTTASDQSKGSAAKGPSPAVDKKSPAVKGGKSSLYDKLKQQ